MNVILPQGASSGRRVVKVYLATTALFTLAASVIWGVNTLFLLGAGLDIFAVMIVNSAFSIGQVVFEIPTGVVADTIGRKASYLLGIATLFVSTLLYVASSRFDWGITGFLFASALLGFGFTFQTGAVDAWLVDALDHLQYEVPRDQVFARGGMVGGVSMLFGTLAGGFLGQVSLELPYVLRAVLLVGAFSMVLAFMREIGFEPRPLKIASVGTEAERIFKAGMEFGWRSPVVRPLMLVSLVQGLFMMYLFYSSQPLALEVLGREDLVWVAAAVTALFALMGVVGNLCVGPLTRTRFGSSPSRVLAAGAGLLAVLAGGIGLTGVLTPESGSLTAFAVMAVLFAIFGVTFGIIGPVRQAFINTQIPSAQRATVLSLDSFFSDVGGSIGQPSFGWIAKTASISAGYLVGSAVMTVALPLYRRAGAALQGEPHIEPPCEPEVPGADHNCPV